MATRRRVLAKKLRLNADAWRFEEGHALVNSDDKREREARGERWFWYSLACVVESYQGDFGELERALGMHMIGPHVTDMIAAGVAALRLEATSDFMAATIHAHPTLSEAMLEAYEDAVGHAIHKM